MTYTTVEEMGEKVNELYDLLHKAKMLSEELRRDNNRLASIIKYHPETITEVRPLSMEERLSEAQRYESVFRTIYGIINLSIDTIADNY